MKKLVAYFSASGQTKKIAEKVAAAAGADLFEIKPVTPYTREDLNWRDINSRSSYEMTHRDFRPPMAEQLENAADYDVIYLGFPIWWHTAPTIINTFLESADFSGKKIAVFATSGSEAIEKTKTLEDLHTACPKGALLAGGKLLSRVSDDEIAAWAKCV